LPRKLPRPAATSPTKLPGKRPQLGSPPLVFRVDEDLKNNLACQKQENVKLQNQIGVLKHEKTQLQQHLMGLQRRIGEVEIAIGQGQAAEE
jgi:hypothetical protein